jgi:hypothetical protein
MLVGEAAAMMPGEGIGEFGDVRRAERGAWLFDQIVATGCLVLRRVGGDRAGEIAAPRFLDAPQVTAAEIIARLARRTGERCRGRRVIVAPDTTEINFTGRHRARRGLGPAGDRKTPGFFVHAAVAVDVADEPVVGLIDAAVWTRRAGRVSDRRQRALAQKESQRWLATAQAAAARAVAAEQVIVVGDRESDIYALFARRPPGLELLVRAAQDRALGDGTRLFSCAAAWPVLGVGAVTIGPRGPGDKGRTARVGLRAGTVRIARPQKSANRSDPAFVTSQPGRGARRTTAVGGRGGPLATADHLASRRSGSSATDRAILSFAVAHRADVSRLQQRRSRFARSADP